MRTITTWSDLLRPGDAPSFFDRNPLPPFEPNASGYSVTNAWWMAELCRLIYRHDLEEDASPLAPHRSAFLSKAGLRQRVFFNAPETGTQGFLVESVQAPLFAALVFRGSEQEVKDVIADFKAIREPLGNQGASVHEGFQEALDSVWDKFVTPELDKVKVPIFYTGHSLGAALAVLATARRKPNAAYTFGSPLVGNEAFADSIKNVPIYRIVDGSDVVTTLPPEVLGYQHAGELHRIDGVHKSSLIPFVRPPKRLADHAPINYVERIEQ